MRVDKMKATKTMTKDMDMTSGPLLKKLIAVSLPLALSGILQLLFNAADLIVIGRFSETGTQSLAAVSSNVALINLVINVVIGLSIGTNVVMSQAIGRKDEDRAQRTVHTSLLIAVISGVAVGIMGVFCARYFLVWMKTDPEILDKATAYLSIYFIGTPANVLYNFGASILRAKGDTKRPLVYLSIAGAVNVVLNLIFVIVARLDVKGVAIATIVSQYISCIFIIIALLREKGYCRFALKKLRIHKRELLQILKVGLPSGILNSFFSIANVLIQTNLNVFGYSLVAGSSTTPEHFANLIILAPVLFGHVQNPSPAKRKTQGIDKPSASPRILEMIPVRISQNFRLHCCNPRFFVQESDQRFQPSGSDLHITIQQYNDLLRYQTDSPVVSTCKSMILRKPDQFHFRKLLFQYPDRIVFGSIIGHDNPAQTGIGVFNHRRQKLTE